MELFDTHCHLDVEDFDIDREQVLEHCNRLGVKRIVIPAINAHGWRKLLDLCQHKSGLYPALGLHPVYADSHKKTDIDALEKIIAETRPVAVGEIGLDYFLKDLDREKQQQQFEDQLDIARNTGLPVILHARKSHDAILACLRRIRVKGGIVHAFNGSEQQARHFIGMGFKLGFGGTMTYERSRKIRQLALTLPLESLVLETDAPDMVVSTHRGQRNSPEYLPECLHALANIRDESPAFIAEQTTRNACNVLNLD